MWEESQDLQVAEKDDSYRVFGQMTLPESHLSIQKRFTWLRRQYIHLSTCMDIRIMCQAAKMSKPTAV